MESLKMRGPNRTLVDVVEEKLLQYLKDNDYCIGCTVPNEMELASSLGGGSKCCKRGSESSEDDRLDRKSYQKRHDYQGAFPSGWYEAFD